MPLMKIAAGLAVAAVALAGCGSSVKTVHDTTTATVTATQTVQATVTATPVIQKVIATRTRTATVTYHPTYTTYGEGTYVVGSDIKPGTYHTTGSPDNDCYWATLNSLDTSDIADNNDSSGPQTIQVPSSVKALQVRGDCTFGPA
jgi:hypothetical protein